MSNNEIQAEAKKLVDTKHSNGIRIRIRRIVAEARRRELPVALMPSIEYDRLQNSATQKKEEEQQERLVHQQEAEEVQRRIRDGQPWDW